MLVSVVMPWGPRCFRCLLEMLSIPMAGEFLSLLIICLVSCVVAKMAVGSSENWCLRLRVCLSSLCLGRWLMFA